MLKLIIEGEELFNEETQEFQNFEDVTVEFEHSLLSLSKWESKHKVPFLSPDKKTPEDLFDYIQAMVITPHLDPEVLLRLSNSNIKEIQAYIDSSESATTFGDMPTQRGPGEIITSELIYYWMVAFTIPFECECWHINRLFALIRICNIKNSPETNRPRQEIARTYHDLNEQRKAQLGTTG